METKRAWSEYIAPTFAIAQITSIYSIYMFLHIVPELEKSHWDPAVVVEAGVFQVLALLVGITYIQVSFTDPGGVPSTIEWLYSGAEHAISSVETKKTGQMRHCKWCGKYKPDRCHHCRSCQRCVLRMDHHCPWILNCVGFYNYKYFLMLLFYGDLSCLFVAKSIYPTVQEVLQQPWSPRVVAVVYADAMSLLLFSIVTPFLVFHASLLCSNMTTIEYCEKATKYRSVESRPPVDYNVGVGSNISIVLGPWYLWLLPVASGIGDGFAFAHNETLPLLAKKKGRAARNTTIYSSTSRTILD